MCSIQEYVFQGANMFKAITTVIISCMACFVVKQLKSPQLNAYYLKWLCFMYTLPFVLLALSIYFESSSPFCSSSGSHKDNIAYVVVFLPPIYICVAINFAMYGVIKKRAKHIVQFFSVIYRTSSASVDTQLLVIVNKLRIYPNVFCFCWLPEVVYILILIIADERVTYLGIISGIFINSSGTLVAVCYLHQQYLKHHHAPPSQVTDAAAHESVSSDPPSSVSVSSSPAGSSLNPLVIASAVTAGGVSCCPPACDNNADSDDNVPASTLVSVSAPAPVPV
jgi:hypothetical protein